MKEGTKELEGCRSDIAWQYVSKRTQIVLAKEFLFISSFV